MNILKLKRKEEIFINYLYKIAKTYHFDYEFYLHQYPDLQKNGIHTFKQALLHYIKYGLKEKRVCNSESLIRNYRQHLLKALEPIKLDNISFQKQESNINLLISTSNRPTYIKRESVSFLYLPSNFSSTQVKRC